MSVNLNNTFYKTPTINYDALQTFNTSFEEDDKVSTSFTSLASDKFPAIYYTENLFQARPDLFGPFAMSLIYAQHSGTSYKPDVVYNHFEQYIKYGPSSIVNILKRRLPLTVYEFTPNFVILWAKILRASRSTITFEPIMTKLNRALNEWFQHKNVVYNGIRYDLAVFKSLCYTRSGECFYALLPYICYVITFLVDCRPYSFNETHTESSTFGFLSSFNVHLTNYYNAFREDTNIDLLKSDPTSLPPTISDKQVNDMIQTMLHPDNITKLRNEEIGKTPQLLIECIKDQTELSDEYVAKAFDNTFTRLVTMIVQQNPIKYIFDALPRFKYTNNININELINWTSYCIAGGNAPFIIETGLHASTKVFTTDFTNVLHCDEDKVLHYPRIICDEQSIPSKITTLQICKHQPFVDNDLVLNLTTAYVRKKFEEKRGDILDDDPIAVTESDIWHDNNSGKPFSVVIKNLFLNGVWANDNSSMMKVLDQLCNIPEFVSEITDMLSLSNVTQLVYNNKFASALISTYLLSFMNEIVLDCVLHGYDLRLIRPYRWLVRTSVDNRRMGKLSDMLVSLMYINNPKYVTFVNTIVNDFVSILEQHPIIQQPYIKRLNDLADIYAIGGCELYKWAIHPNPLVRGAMWNYNVIGWSEEFETLYQWLLMLDNAALMEMLETNLNDAAVIDATLKTQFTKVLQARRYPVLLANYEFDGSFGYKFKRDPYMVSLSTDHDGSILSLLIKRAYRRSTANQATMETISFKRIGYATGGQVVAMKSLVNKIDIDGILHPAHVADTGRPLKVPIYDVLGKMDEVKVLYPTPSGYRVIPLILGHLRNIENQTMLIYTKTAAKTRFDGGRDYLQKNRL